MPAPPEAAPLRRRSLGLAGTLPWIALCACGLGSASLPAAAPPEKAASLLELAQVTDLSSLAASPDGRFVAFRTDRPSVDRNSYELLWHVLDTSSGTIVQAAGGGEPIVRDPGILVVEPPIWSADGHWFYFRGLRDGAVQVWRAAVDGTSRAIVTQEEGDVLSMERSADGEGLVYRVGAPREAVARAEAEEYDRGILVDQHVELGQNVFRGAIINGRRASERLIGSWFTRGGLLWEQAPRQRSLGFASVAAVDAAPGAAPEPPTLEGGGVPDASARSIHGHLAAAVWSGDSGFLFVQRPTPGAARISCAAAECRSSRIDWVAWRPNRDEVVFATAGRSGVQTLRLWEVSSGRVRALATGEGLLNGGASPDAPCAIAADAAICVAAGPTSPPRLERIALDAGRGRTLFDPNMLLRARHWPEVERLQWRSREGRLFTGILFKPGGRTGKAAPLFINYYLCEGFVRGGVGDEWPFAAFAAGGIASVCINKTRMTGPQDGVGQYRAALGGIEALVEELAARGMIDRRRVGIGGLSFGSEVAMWALMHSDLIAAASVASPQFEPANFWFNGVRGRDVHALLRKVWGLGAPEETPEQWKLVSPALNVERIRAPLLLQLPEQESRYAVELYARLSNSPTPTEMYVYPDERHIKTQPRHRLSVYQRNLDWFRFWLQGHADDDPAKADQYRRWRALAERARAGEAALQDRSQSSSDARSNSRK